MQTRRTTLKKGLASLIALGGLRSSASLAQEITMTPMELNYEGMLAVGELPELPIAPEGEVAVVAQSIGTRSQTAAVFHNATDEPVFINGVIGTGMNEDGVVEDSVPDETLFAPIVLEPGKHGIAVVTFPAFFNEYTDVTIELDLAAAESDLDPSVVNMPVVYAEYTDEGNSINMQVQNRSQETLAEGSGFIAVYFTETGEIDDWIHSAFMSEIDPGEQKWMSHSSTGLTFSDRFMMGFMGRVL